MSQLPNYNKLENKENSSAKLGSEIYKPSKYSLHETLRGWFGPYVLKRRHFSREYQNVEQFSAIALTLFIENYQHCFIEQTFVFTTLGARGETGPKNTSGYVGTSLEDKVTLANGIQIWTVPVTGIYAIEVSGASGANGSISLGGLGAKIKGTFKLYQGTQLKILVGQEGHHTEGFGDAAGGGGGGSFVAFLNNTPLIIAGGGGGGGSASKRFQDGDPGQATENGTRCGGTGGSGGQVCDLDTGNIDSGLIAGGGAGLKGDGNAEHGIAQTPSSFIKGGTGGTCLVSQGGFGGGAFAFALGGGGGGYSGGGVVGTSSNGVAGGGGSYNSGTNQLNMAGVNKGHGKVIIKFKP